MLSDHIWGKNIYICAFLKCLCHDNFHLQMKKPILPLHCFNVTQQWNYEEKINRCNFYLCWRESDLSHYDNNSKVMLLLLCLSFVALSVRGLVCCMSLLSAPEQDTERVWHLLAGSNRSQSAAGGKGVDVDGMRTGNGCVPSLCCKKNRDWRIPQPSRKCQGDCLDPQVTLSFSLLCFSLTTFSPLFTLYPSRQCYENQQHLSHLNKNVLSPAFHENGIGKPPVSL